MVAPDDAPFAVDRPDPVPVAIESHSEIEGLCGDELFQIGKVFLDSRVGMMIGKFAVDFGMEKMMLSGQPLDQLFKSGSGRPVAGIPTDANTLQRLGIDPVECGNHARDVFVDDVAIFDRACTVAPFAGSRTPAKLLDVRAEKRTALKDHLEAIVIGGIVAAGYLNAAVDIAVACFGII